MERHRPCVFILSDGSGGAGTSRLSHSLATLDAAGASAGEVFGQMPDVDWYSAMLARDARPLRRVADMILAAALQRRPATLVSDSVDGHNPLHDLCEALAIAVTKRLAAEGLAIRHLTSPATAGAIGRHAESWTLDDAAAGRKRAAAGAYGPLAEEIRRVLSAEPGALRSERLLTPTFEWPEHWQPGWEAFGRKRIAEGRFRQAITWSGHVRPLARAILGPDAAVGREPEPFLAPAGTA